MCLTGWADYFYVIITAFSACLIIFGVGIVAVLEFLGKRSEKQISDAIDQATEFQRDFD